MTSQAILELQDGSSAGLQNGRIAKGDLQEESALDLPLFVHGAIPALRQDSRACFWSASRIGRGYPGLGTRYWVRGTGYGFTPATARPGNDKARSEGGRCYSASASTRRTPAVRGNRVVGQSRGTSRPPHVSRGRYSRGSRMFEWSVAPSPPRHSMASTQRHDGAARSGRSA